MFPFLAYYEYEINYDSFGVFMSFKKQTKKGVYPVGLFLSANKIRLVEEKIPKNFTS
jgi:hypothetical protein